ncbi:hypothetical protein [Flavobacterium sangjuense]|uniref:Uncharacterized protein n=1 Tax=Flavobacterium sangjuense TaxID=2518177 RepID=A0A4V1CC93_9FLAO|nr:hypothetical protein [Flavobacterium sangjuense]QBZ98684.1 hypothetical protein GS03_02194 [Flavobacterium sangjuense]
MKHLIYLTILFLATTTLSAQEIKLNESIVYVGDKPAFSFAKKSFNNELYVYKLNTKEVLVHMLVDTNGTEIKQDDGKKLVFEQQKVTIQSKNFRTRKWEFLIALLIEEKVIDLNGDINLDNLNRFKAKYDDNDVNKTMR